MGRRLVGLPQFVADARQIAHAERSSRQVDHLRGLARLGDDDRVHLNTRAFIPTEEFADIAYYFGRNLRDHIAASSHNLLGGDPAMLEQAVYYEELTPQSVEELQRLSREVGSSMLVKINQRAFELAERDKGKGDASQRITFGVYFFAAPDDDDRADGGV